MSQERRSRWTRTAALLSVGLWMLGGAPALAKTTVGATYGQVGARSLSAYTLVDGAPRKAYAVLETKRFSRRRTGVARSTTRRLARSGRTTLTIGAPRGTKRITARVRVITRTKRNNGRVRTRTVGTGRWTTIELTRTGRTAKVGAVKPKDVVAVTAPTAAAPGSIQLTGASSRVRPGEVIALGITPAAPDGLLAQVTQVTPSGNGTVASLVPARLSDVVPAGAFDVDIPVEQVASISGKTTSEKTPRALQCTSSRSATAAALAELSAGVKLSAKWTGGSMFPPRLPQLQAGVTGTVEARLEGELSLNGEAKCTLAPQTLFPAPVRLATFTVQVGPVPIPVVIDGQVTLTGSAEATGSLSTSVKARASAAASVTYDRGKLTPGKTFERSFTHQPPAVNGTGSAQVTLSPAIGVRLAGAAGPEIDLSGGLKLTGNLAAPAGQPWWTLTAPVSLGAKFKFALWGIEVDSPRYELWGEEFPVASADPATGAPGSSIAGGGPAPEPLPPGVRTRLTWDSDTDVDLHTWNQTGDHAYFRDLEAIPGGYLDRDVIPGYGPETFFETDPAKGNQFTFGVCQYSGKNANVIVDVRDPDGQTRRYTVTLRGRKAAALLTTSPVGIAPYIDPDGDWCNGDGGDPTQLGQVTTGSFG
ncbi:hypothetical protein C8N24_0741 [Solirubrobacter pauli]|uniref:Uncharacterized protein n=1 Tax=Solirubrobacter pauli TaxID=166793 RepID=A0A660L969_9ACTN|nr:hypothetical protein [Solirubrobacter pauli]RKQ90926.1 hypothetical protein C8N24_0741 [Solirubrobacter pauli]